MKMNKLYRRLFGWFILLLVLGGLSVPAYAVSNGEYDPGRSGSIALSCFYNNKPVSGGNLVLYRVAELEYESPQYHFRLCNELGGGKLTQADLDRSSLAGELAAHDGLKTLSGREKTFGQDGAIRFENVMPGLYLLVQTKPARGYERMEPVLVSMPFLDPRTGQYIYDVDAACKPAIERSPQPTPRPTTRPGRILPQTGQLNWPVPVFAVAGTFFVVLGLLMLASDRRRSRQ